MFISKCKYQVCVLAGILCMACSVTLGQDQVHKPNKKAQKEYDEAVEAYMRKEEAQAMTFIAQALERDSLYYDAWMLHSQLAQQLNDFDVAALSMSRAMALKPSAIDKWGIRWSRLLHRSGAYFQALKVWESLNLDDDAREEYALLEASLHFAIQSFMHPESVDAQPLQGNVNTENPEYYPSIFVSSDRMIFTRQVDAEGRFEGQEDFFEAVEVNGAWEDLGAIQGVNTRGNEGAPSVRGDGRRLIFTACETLHNGYGPRNGQGSCDLFEAEWNAAQGRYDREVNLNALNTPFWESQPSLSADGNEIYFVRAQRNLRGDMQQNIWHSARNASGEWETPKRLTSTINTKGKEENPVLHPDGKTLYFASNGHPGMGGTDLYVSRKDTLDRWTTPMNLGYPINTKADENSLQVFPDGRRALFASDREQPGNLDLWEFNLPERVQAMAVSHWSGRVFDVANGQPVEAEVVVYSASGTQLSVMVSDPMDGSFSLPMVQQNVLTMEVNHQHYAFYHTVWNPDKLETTQGESAQELEIGLTRLEIGTVLLLRDVQFETNSATLDEVFQPELNQLVSTMNGSDVRIRIVGHTDNLGTETFNQKLSENRAKSVASYLEQNGIEAWRMETQGMGADEPVASNASESGRAANRRTEIIIID